MLLKIVGMCVHQRWSYNRPRAAPDYRDYLGEGDTLFEQIQSGFYKVETYTPTLLAAMRNAAGTLREP